MAKRIITNDLKKFYIKIIQKYKDKCYKLTGTGIIKPIINEKQFSFYALDYIIWEYCKANKDDRWKSLYKFIVVPTTTETCKDKITLKDFGLDLSVYDIGDFVEFIKSVKN
jgi:hypothetical protein